MTIKDLIKDAISKAFTTIKSNLVQNTSVSTSTAIPSAAVTNNLQTQINTLNSKFGSSRTAIATGSHNFTTIGDTNCTFTLSSPRMIEVYNDYNTSMPLFVAIAIKSGNVYTIVSSSTVESTSSVTIGRLTTQAYLLAGSYTVLAKSNSNSNNTVGVFGYN